MSLDVAVEFATLGELRLVDSGGVPAAATAPPASPAADAARLFRTRRQIELSDVDRALLPRPSTALARATVPAGAAVAAPGARHTGADLGAGCEQRHRLGEPAEQPRRPAPRNRAGAVQPPAQLCLLVD